MGSDNKIILHGRLGNEYVTIATMVKIYCKAHHQGGKEVCDDCADFLEYAHQRLDRCPYGQAKPTCKKCPIHCYKPDYKEKSRAIMRFSGPKMILRHPVLAIRHMLAESRPVPDRPLPGLSNRHQRKKTEKQLKDK